MSNSCLSLVVGYRLPSEVSDLTRCLKVGVFKRERESATIGDVVCGAGDEKTRSEESFPPLRTLREVSRGPM